MAQRNDRLNRERAQRGHLQVNQLSDDNASPKEETSYRSPLVSGERGWIHGDFEAISRWEDDGGRVLR